MSVQKDANGRYVTTYDDGSYLDGNGQVHNKDGSVVDPGSISPTNAQNAAGAAALHQGSIPDGKGGFVTYGTGASTPNNDAQYAYNHYDNGSTQAPSLRTATDQENSAASNTNANGGLGLPGLGGGGSDGSLTVLGGIGGAAAGALGAGGGGSSDIVDAVNKVSQEAFGYANQNRDFQMQGLANANANYAPATGQYASMYGPGGSLTGAGTGETAFAQQGGNLLNPTATGQTYGALSGLYQQPGQAQKTFDASSGAMQGPSASAGNYAQFSGQLAGPSQAASTFGSGAQYDGNAMQQGAPAIMQAYGKQQNLEGQLGNITAGYSAPSQSSQTFGQQQPQLSQAGGLENFASSDLAGTNPYYRQLQAQQSADIDASMNARGGFNSGAALKAQALGASNLAAQQYQQEGQLQGQAQSAQLQRLGQDQQFAGQVDTSKYNALSGLTSATGTADTNRLAATSGQAQTTQALANTNLGYMTQQQNAANAVAAQVAQNAQVAGNMAAQSDTASTNRYTALNNAANNANQTQLQGYNQLGQLAANSDTATQNQYKNYLDAANTAQTTAQQRQQQGFTDANTVGNEQAVNTLNATQAAGSQYASMVGAGMGAQLNAAQLQAQINQQNQANTLGYAGLLVKGATALAGA